jgi:penicillin-binding protein 1B
VAVAWVGNDDNRPAGVTGSNAAMHVWAGLFRGLPLESVDLRMPDGASWLWVDRDSGRLTAEQCPGAIQLPYVAGSEPGAMTECLASVQESDSDSFWRKLFGKKK